MELTLTLQPEGKVSVDCNGVFSHTFDMRYLQLGQWDAERRAYLISDPVELGKSIYKALLPTASSSLQLLERKTDRILIVAQDPALEAIPWEFLHGPKGYLGLDIPILRGLPLVHRKPAPDISNTSLRIMALASNPIGDPRPLDIEGEWLRLCEIVQNLEYKIVLERVRPPTLTQLRRKVANRQWQVVHFMGHGGQSSEGTVLQFETENGAENMVNAHDFIRRVGKNVFLVTLNACVTASPRMEDVPEDTGFTNLAQALAQQGVPYALGMRFAIPDEDAKVFARAMYDELARGTPVEEAIVQMRNELASRDNPFTIGIPVLYTALSEPAPGFALTGGKPVIDDGQPPMDVTAIPKAEGAFQGRVPELLALGQALTGDTRPKLLTIHGGGGLGKTALAREAVERFAHAWPGGVWAISLENLPSCNQFVNELAQFLRIDIVAIQSQIVQHFSNASVDEDEAQLQRQVERAILGRLNNRRTLVVLDNVETLIEAVEASISDAFDLVAFLREQISGTNTSLLVTSRNLLGWTGEESLELGGLTPEEGARLFWQSSPGRIEAVGPLAQEVSKKVDGHPLSLRLLGGAFDACELKPEDFIRQYEQILTDAQDKYKHLDHRHRSLYASIDTSVRYLSDDLHRLLSGLWLFHAPFYPATAAEIFAPLEVDESNKAALEKRQSEIKNSLLALQRRGLLVGEQRGFRDDILTIYRLLPTMRPYVREMKQAFSEEQLLARFGTAYADLAQAMYLFLNNGSGLVWLADQARVDFIRGIQYTAKEKQGWYQNNWGWVLQQLGDRKTALALLSVALEAAQGQDPELERHVLFNLAEVYSITGQSGKALKMFEQVLSIVSELGDRTGEAAALNSLARVYRATGHPGRALELYERALLITRKVGERAGESTTLRNIAAVYQTTGRPGKALKMLEESLLITREVGNRVGEAKTLDQMAAVYQSTGQPGRALELYEQALPILREGGNRDGEAATLNNMAVVYQSTGQLEKALELYEQVLPIQREVGDRDGEAAALNNMAAVYLSTGQPGKAQGLFEQALPIYREVDAPAGEATALNNMAMVFRSTGQWEKSLALYEQSLPIAREVGDQALEGKTLNNMAAVYEDTGQLGSALELYEQALLIMREVGDQAGEATTLNNIAGVYKTTGQPGKALELYERALLITREVGERAGEAATLNGLAYVLVDLKRYDEALPVFGESVQLEKQVQNPAGESAGLVGMALLLYQHLTRNNEAVERLQQAIQVLMKNGLSQDAAGHTLQHLQQTLQIIQSGDTLPGSPSTASRLSSQNLQDIVVTTIAVMTVMAEKQAEWRGILEGILKKVQEMELTQEIEFFRALLTLLGGGSPILSSENPHREALKTIQAGIADGGTILQQTAREAEDQVVPADSALGGFLPEDFVNRCVAGIKGGSQEKQAAFNYLVGLAARQGDAGPLIQVVQMAILGQDPTTLGGNLIGKYAEIWKLIFEKLSEL